MTPTGYNNLPFGPSDVLGLGFKFEALYDKGVMSEPYADLRGKNETYLIDDTTCTFYSRFSINELRYWRNPYTFDA